MTKIFKNLKMQVLSNCKICESVTYYQTLEEVSDLNNDNVKKLENIGSFIKKIAKIRDAKMLKTIALPLETMQ